MWGCPQTQVVAQSGACFGHTNGGRVMEDRTTVHVRIGNQGEMVMAKVIEFYIPKSFRRPFRIAVQPHLGKIIEFRLQTKKSA
jgi:hypothetical protein